MGHLARNVKLICSPPHTRWRQHRSSFQIVTSLADGAVRTALKSFLSARDSGVYSSSLNLFRLLQFGVQKKKEEGQCATVAGIVLGDEKQLPLQGSY